MGKFEIAPASWSQLNPTCGYNDRFAPEAALVEIRLPLYRPKADPTWKSRNVQNDIVAKVEL